MKKDKETMTDKSSKKDQNTVINKNVLTEKLAHEEKLSNNIIVTSNKSASIGKVELKKSTVEHTAIIGDSMINGLNANGFRKDLKVKIKPFGGATSVDLIDHIKPTLRKKPSKIILHVGTNDITNRIDTIPNLKKIIKLVKSESPHSTVAISSVIIRADKSDMFQKVNELNQNINELCQIENIEVINNSNINTTHLSKRKLHLNQKGLSTLARNFIAHLS